MSATAARSRGESGQAVSAGFSPSTAGDYCFRAEYSRHAGEQDYEEFLAQIRAHSPLFREWWDAHEVIETQRGTKVLEHPLLGTLRLNHAQTVPTGQPELRLAVYAPADEATRAALATL